MTLNDLKLRRAVTFMKYIVSLVSLIFLAKTLIFPDIKLDESCRANGRWAYEGYLPKNLPKFLFLFDLSLLNVKISRAYK